MGPEKRKAGRRRLADMNAAEPQRLWVPDLEPECPPYEDTFPISDDVRYVQKLGFDEHQRLVEWAVVQMCREGDRWRRVASYRDIEEGLDYAIQRVTECWQENDRRSRRGY